VTTILVFDPGTRRLYVLYGKAYRVEGEGLEVTDPWGRTLRYVYDPELDPVPPVLMRDGTVLVWNGGGFEEVLTTSGPEDVLPLADAGILLTSRTGSYLVDLKRDRPEVPPVDAVWNDHGPCGHRGLVVAVREGDAVRVIIPLGPSSSRAPGRCSGWTTASSPTRVRTAPSTSSPTTVAAPSARRKTVAARVGPFVVLRERGTYELLARLTDGPRVGLLLPEARSRDRASRRRP